MVRVFISTLSIKTELVHSTILIVLLFILLLPKSKRLNIFASTLSYCRQSLDFFLTCGLQLTCTPSFNLNFILFQVCFPQTYT